MTKRDDEIASELKADTARMIRNLSTTDVPHLDADLQQALRALSLALHHAWPFDPKEAHRRAQARYRAKRDREAVRTYNREAQRRWRASRKRGSEP